MGKIRYGKAFAVAVVILGFFVTMIIGDHLQQSQTTHKEFLPSDAHPPEFPVYADIISVEHKGSITPCRILTIEIRYSFATNSGEGPYIYGILHSVYRNLTLLIWRYTNDGEMAVIHGNLKYKVVLPTSGEWTINVNDYESTTVMVREQIHPGLRIGLIGFSILLVLAIPVYILRRRKRATV